MCEEAPESIIREGCLDARKVLAPEEVACVAVAVESVTFSYRSRS